MGASRFDQAARFLSHPRSRRASLAMLLGGLFAVGEIAGLAKKGKSRKKCRKCKSCEKCIKGKCKAKPDNTPCPEDRICQGGKCLCPSGTANCQNGPTATCCPNGQACLPDSICGACPVTGYCDSDSVVFCGFVPGSPCICVTSVDDATVCSNQNGLCLACTSDAQCTTALGVPAVCVTATGNRCASVGCPAQEETVCLQASC